MSMIEKIAGINNKREVRKLERIADKIEALDYEMRMLTDEQLRSMTDLFKARLADGETLDDILPEAFAVCREGAARCLGMKPHRVQLIGGIAMHQGRIAEMKTGEGKTLAASMPAYLNALEGKGVHVVTLNDYLAKRDAEQMGKLYSFIGISAGCVAGDTKAGDRPSQYLADITYGTGREFGADFLRDNLAVGRDELTQRGLYYAIVDDADMVLIGEDSSGAPLVSLQNYYRKYRKIAGMTCTAKTDEEEFIGIYNMDVVEIPVNKAAKRIDHEDVIYATKKEKYEAVMEAAAECFAEGRPVLIGTVSAEESEILSEALGKRGITHNVIEGRNHERDAGIIADAGRQGAVTIAVNLAGTGTDIIPGGNPDSEEIRLEWIFEQNRINAMGGLLVIGTERNGSRRLDDRLRQRTGIQGNPGETRFFLSLEDDLIRLHGDKSIKSYIKNNHLQDRGPVEFPKLRRAFDNIQKQLETRNYKIRRSILQDGSIMNIQK